MVMKTLIKSGRVVTAVDDYKADILIEDGTVSTIIKGGLYGNDSPLYGAMGFVRKSEKKSGLTRKKKT